MAEEESPQLAAYRRAFEVEAALLESRREALIKHGFTREEAMRIIIAAVPATPIPAYTPQGGE